MIGPASVAKAAAWRRSTWASTGVFTSSTSDMTMIAVLGGVEPEHRVVAQAHIVEADGEHHHGHGRDQLGLGHDQVARGQMSSRRFEAEQVVVLLADGDARRARPACAPEFVIRLDIDADTGAPARRPGLPMKTEAKRQPRPLSSARHAWKAPPRGKRSCTQRRLTKAIPPETLSPPRPRRGRRGRHGRRRESAPCAWARRRQRKQPLAETDGHDAVALAMQHQNRRACTWPMRTSERNVILDQPAHRREGIGGGADIGGRVKGASRMRPPISRSAASAMATAVPSDSPNSTMRLARGRARGEIVGRDAHRGSARPRSACRSSRHSRDSTAPAARCRRRSAI